MDAVENAPLDERYHVKRGPSTPGVEGGAAVDGLRNGGRVAAAAAAACVSHTTQTENASIQAIIWAPKVTGEAK